MPNRELDSPTGISRIRSNSSRLANKLHENINYQAFLMGIAFVGLLAFSAQYVETRIDVLNLETFYIPLFTSIFIGSSFGHYLGLAVSRDQYEQTPLNSLALGAFLALAGITAYFSTSSPLTMALVLSGIVLLLGHTSRLVDAHQEIERLMERFAERVSPIGLGFIGVLKFGTPFIISAEIRLPNPTFEEMALALAGLVALGLFLNYSQSKNSD